MQKKTGIRGVEGLALKELEAQHAELLPDRLEMHHRRRRRLRRAGRTQCIGFCINL
jgi:hypothetical protein